MKNALPYSLTAGLALAMLGLFVLGCEDQSSNIPVQWNEISGLMATGWAQYAAGDYLDAKASFEAAGQRNAQFLPAYDGLGWCAVRLTNFSEAEQQFSFITTLADPQSEMDLLADAYGGLSLSATIERSYLEITEGGDQETLNALAQQSIDRANTVFDLLGENYHPADHDTAFGSDGLHLLCAQNYFYLQEYESSEAQLSIVDPDFMPTLLEQVGQEITDTFLPLNQEIIGSDSVWYLLAVDDLGQVTSPGVHTLGVFPPNLNIEGYEIEYHWDSQNRIIVHPAAGAELAVGMEIMASYVYLEDFPNYLYGLIEHIEDLIEF